MGASAVFVAIWPWIWTAFGGTAVPDGTRTTLTGAMVVLVVTAGALSVLAGAARRSWVPDAPAWAVLGIGALLWSVAGVISLLGGVAPVNGPGHGTVVDVLFAVAVATMTASGLLVPPGGRLDLVQRVDLALVVVALAIVGWSAHDIFSGPRNPDTVVRLSVALLGGASILIGAWVVLRAPPQHRPELRGLVAALLTSGAAAIVAATSYSGQRLGYRALGADLLWLAMGMSLWFGGRRLAWPRSDTEVARRSTERLVTWLPALATVAALVVATIHQRLSGGPDAVTTVLGTAVVLLAASRGAIMHERNKQLADRLRGTADDLARASRTDELTGLGNRLDLEDRLGTALRSRSPDGVSVLFIDVDNFKDVNDSLGHEVGDSLLQLLADRLTGVLGPDVFRIGGDEFVAVRDDLDHRSAEAVAAAVVASLGPPVVVGSHRIAVGTSVGLARSELRSDGRRRPDEPRHLLRRADLALYRAKELGRGQWASYEPWLQERADRRLALQQTLRGGLDLDRLVVHYQPVVDLHTGEILGAEALVRWDAPDQGPLLPAEFLTLAREAGLLPAVGEQVLSIALADLASGERPGWVAVNLSAEEVRHPGLVERVERQLRAAGVPAPRLRVEITEEVVLDPVAREVLGGLAAIGVQTCIEDFGTGPTSLQYLAGLSDVTLKMDRSFLLGLGRNQEDRVVLAAITDLAHDLALRVGVEAVSSARQAEELRRLGVEEAQGTHFGEPTSWAELVATRTGGGSPRGTRGTR